MRLSFRTRLLASYLGLVVIAEGITLAVVDRSLEADLVQSLDKRLHQQGMAALAWVERARHREQVAARLAAIADVQVSIVDRAGTLVADSHEVASPDLAELPEIRSALSGQVGSATRWSAGRGEEMRYLAMPAGESLVLRLGAPTAAIAATRQATLLRLLGASAAALGVAALLGVASARRIGRPLREMTQAARQMAAGDYAIRIHPRSEDELGTLARSLDTLAEQLGERIGELIEERDRVGRLESIRRDFLANVSHELRTPVAAVQGYSETLLTGDPDDETRRAFLQVIHRHAQRMGKLVGDLLRLSELEVHPLDPSTFGPVPVAAVARQVARTAQERARERGATMSVEVAPDAVAWGDATALEQVLENLVGNALNYGRPGGTVHIASGAVDDAVWLVVEDDGPGIDPAHLPRLFERFYRVDPARSREVGGTGLGLSIVRQLVSSMGGQVSVESEIGVGTRFRVTLPAAA